MCEWVSVCVALRLSRAANSFEVFRYLVSFIVSFCFYSFESVTYLQMIEDHWRLFAISWARCFSFCIRSFIAKSLSSVKILSTNFFKMWWQMVFDCWSIHIHRKFQEKQYQHCKEYYTPKVFLLEIVLLKYFCICYHVLEPDPIPVCAT